MNSKQIILFLFALSICAKGALAQNISATIGNPITKECGTIAIPVKVTNFLNVGAISLKLNFDKTVLEYESVEINNLIIKSIYNGNNNNGQFSLSYVGDGIFLDPDEVLFTLKFKLLSTISTTTKLSWDENVFKENCEFAGPGGVPVYSGTFVDGEIIIPSELIATVGANPILCNGGTTEVKVSANGGNAPYSGTGTFTVGAGTYNYTVTDANGCSETLEFTITEPEPLQIENVVAYPDVPIIKDSEVEFNVIFTNNIPVDVTICWGDEASSTFEDVDDGLLTASHTYKELGVYSVRIVLEDDCGNKVSYDHDYVVVYDPSAGFVTGGGWIISPPSAYIADPDLSGKANFGFVSKYQKGKNVPTGHTEFQFHAAGFIFSSTEYEWLVVSGDKKAQFKGSGTINGEGNYGFMLTAIDGLNSDPDKFRIKIWDKNNGDLTIYDNNEDTEIVNGSVIIHYLKIKTAEILTSVNLIQMADQMDLNVFPNPFTDNLIIQFIPTSGSHVRFELFNLNGVLIETVFDGQVFGGNLCSLEYEPKLNVNQMLIYRFTINNETRMGKLLFRQPD